MLGAPLADLVDISQQSDAGVVFVHFWDGFSWNQQQRLTAYDADAEDHFGWAVGISGDTVVVGVPQDDDAGLDAGAVSVFVRSGTTWSEQAKLTASDAAANDRFGTAVAIDSDTMVVGAQEDDNGSGGDAGAIYVFVRSGTSWSQQAKLVPSDAAAGIQFGNAVSVDGDVLIAGCEFDNDRGVGSGSVYFCNRVGTTWLYQAKLTASDGVAYDHFGASVTISGLSAAVGAPLNDDHGGDSGSAYVFLKSGSSWVQEAKLTASDAAQFEEFGRSVAMDGSWLAVGSQYNSDGDPYGYLGSVYAFTRTGPSLDWTETDEKTPTGAGGFDQFGHDVAVSGNHIVGGWHMHDRSGATNVGSAAVFYRSGVTWPEQAQLYPDDAAADDRFGFSVSVDGDTAAVGSGGDDHGGMANAGSVSVFENSGGSWAFQQRIFAGDASADAGFGSVAVSGSMMIVGAGAADDNGTQSGAAYAFLRTGSTWAQQDKMVASDGAEYDYFGSAVDIDANIAVIGAWGGDVGAESSGVAYVFSGTGSSWTEDAKLTPFDAAQGDRFGVSVAVSGETIAVGAPQDDDHGSLSGSVYIYVRNGSTWFFQSKLTASDADESDRFGWSVALSGDTLLVGAYNDEAVTASGGSAYVFDRALDCNLFVIKDDGLNSVAVGQEITYTIVAGNEGSGDAFGSTITDNFPADLIDCSWTCIEGGGATCTPGPVSGDIVDTADLPVGGEAAYTATYTVGPAAAGTLSNTVTVAPPPGVVDSDPSDNTATDLDSVIDQVDLAITKDNGLTEVWAGQDLTYTIVASNPTGPEDAVGAAVEDIFTPALSGCSWTCIGSGGGTCSAGPVAGNILDTVDLPVGAEVTYSATCTVLAGGMSKRLDHTPDPWAVNIPGNFQDELGCPGDWQPDCATTYLSFDAEDGVWQGVFTIPAGSWEYKAAMNDSWLENYGLHATQDGPNIPLTVGSPTGVKFYCDHETHWITDDVNSVIRWALSLSIPRP